ncbi:hypothetical protein [Streptomyces sp. NPDC091383]|uniref:hypothetical protein n=1 Tax=Streptomyces sp. NPDC091383 TaxID=3365996 RepID=UPI00380E1AEF
MSRDPITPTRIIPAGEPLPAPASPPPPPPRRPAPPAPPAGPPGPGDWWRTGSGPPGPPPPVPVDVHVVVTVTPGGLPDPPPDPPWWRRIRWGYHLSLAALAFPCCGPWARVLTWVRADGSLTGAWVTAVIPLALVAVWDNAARIWARHSDPDLWMPRIRAAIARLTLYAAAEATALALPLTTIVYLMTGVNS